MSEGIAVEQHGDGRYLAYHDMDRPGLSVTITQALLRIEDVPITETITNFSQYVDTDALDRLFRIPRSGEHRHPDGHVHLEIDGIGVTVHADGEIEIEP